VCASVIDFRRTTALNNLECGVIQKAPVTPDGRDNHRTKRNSDINNSTDYIIGGTNAKVTEHPWHTSISYRHTPGQQHESDIYDYCGATLITKQAVLTGKRSSTASISYIETYFVLQLPIA
jgi:hypothetical protein